MVVWDSQAVIMQKTMLAQLVNIKVSLGGRDEFERWHLLIEA